MTWGCGGRPQVGPEIAEELLQAADQYLLAGLKRRCETSIASRLDCLNLLHCYDLSESYHAPHLAVKCALFALERAAELKEAHGERFYSNMWQGTTMLKTLQGHVEALLCGPPAPPPAPPPPPPEPAQLDA